MPTRDQDGPTDLEVERLMRDHAQSMQQIVNSVGTLEELSRAHRLMPSPSELSRHANGSYRETRADVRRFLAMIVAMKRCGASEAEAEYLLLQAHQFTVEIYSDDYGDFRSVLREAKQEDAEEESFYALFSTLSDRDPEDYEALAEHLEEQAAASRVAAIRARQRARNKRMA